MIKSKSFQGSLFVLKYAEFIKQKRQTDADNKDLEAENLIYKEPVGKWKEFADKFECVQQVNGEMPELTPEGLVILGPNLKLALSFFVVRQIFLN